MINKLEKGSCIFYQDLWYVLVEAITDGTQVWLHCICDNANNIYSWVPDKDMIFLTPKESLQLSNYRWLPDRYDDAEHLHQREIPVEVIAEVLSGLHDDRFSK